MNSTATVIHIALCANERYFPGVYCAVGSALQSLRPSYHVVVHVIDAGLNESNKILLEKLVESGGIHSMEWIESPYQRFADLPSTHYHISAVYRLALPELIDVDRVIYLDADTLVFGCLGELWEGSLTRNEPLLAVKDLETTSIAADSKAFANAVGACGIEGYFNSGVMVLKLDDLRDDGFCQKIYLMLQKHGAMLRFPDQTALNWHFAHCWGAIDGRWNYPAWLFDNQQGNDLPSICHFTNHAPWLIRRYSPSQALFEQVAKSLGLELHSFEKGLLKSVVESCRLWGMAPIRCCYQVIRTLASYKFPDKNAAPFHGQLSRYWFNYFFSAPSRLLTYRKRIHLLKKISE